MELTVSAPQGLFLSGLDRKYRAYVGGFGSGKTFVGCLDLLLFAGRVPGVQQGYFAPTYRDIRDTFWPTLDEAAEMLGFRAAIRRADKEVDLFRGNVFYGTIICRSLEDPGAIVGFKIARALVDEIDIMATDKARTAWRKIQARMRLVVKGEENSIGVATTPEGFKFTYETFAREPGANYAMVQASTYENEAYLPDDYIRTLMADYPEELVQAYINGQFVNLTAGTVYRNYTRDGNRSAEVLRQPEGERPGEPLHIGQDFNVGDMASVVMVQRDNGWHAVDEVIGLRDTPHLIETIHNRFKGHAIYMYPDASGDSRKSVDASKSDLELLRQARFNVRAPKANPRVRDRVLSVNTAFSKQRLWVNDTKCPRLAEALEQQAYDKNGEPDKTTGHDHPNDAIGYFTHWTMPVRKPAVFVGVGMR